MGERSRIRVHVSWLIKIVNYIVTTVKNTSRLLESVVTKSSHTNTQ